MWVNDTKVISNPDYAKAVKAGRSTYKIPRKLYLYETDGADILLPYGCLKDVFKFFTDEQDLLFSFKLQEQLPKCNKSIPLYDYQQIAVTAMCEQFTGILQAPAGSGKTQMGLAMVQKLKLKTLWLTHTLDLVKQSKDRASQFFPEGSLGEISQGRVQIGSHITFATVQTMSRLDLTQYRDTWDCLIVDECHRVAGTPASVTQMSKVINSLATPFQYGLSATVHRADGMIVATKAILGDVAYEVPQSAVSGRVMPVKISPVYTGIRNSASCMNFDGTLNYAGMLTYLCDNGERNRQIVSLTKDLVRDGHSVLLLTSRVSQLKRLVNEIPSCRAIDGTTKPIIREKYLQELRTGKAKVLLATYQLAKEGLDIPCLDRLILVTPQKDMAIVVQSVGRIARTVPGKTDAVAYDLIDNIPYCLSAYKKRVRIYRRNNCIV